MFVVVAAPVAPAVGVTLTEFEVRLQSRSCLDLRPWELMEYTVVCWLEWEGPSGAGGESEQEPSTPPARWHVPVLAQESFVAQTQ